MRSLWHAQLQMDDLCQDKSFPELSKQYCRGSAAASCISIACGMHMPTSKVCAHTSTALLLHANNVGLQRLRAVFILIPGRDLDLRLLQQ